jgi:hypothetical protein
VSIATLRQSIDPVLLGAIRSEEITHTFVVVAIWDRGSADGSSTQG